MTIVIATAGTAKHAPASANPAKPARRWPRWMAISVEFGPGMRLQAPIMSRNSSCETQRRRRTTSSSIIAICAAGPPKATVPSRRNSRASSPSRARRSSGATGGALACGVSIMGGRASSMSDRRQHQDLAAHLGLMHEAFEAEQALAMKREDPRGLLQHRQFFVHQDIEIAVKQGKIVLVVRLQIPELDL